VNSAAIFTYLPILAAAQPITINGMCYAMRTADARDLDVFASIERCITDDLALAKFVRRTGGRIAQTAEAQFISTTVSSPVAFLRLLHRWFVFTRLLVSGEPLIPRLGVIVGYGAPTALLWTLLAFCAAEPGTAEIFVPVLFIRAALIIYVQRRLIGGVRHYPLLSVLMELATPFFLIAATLNGTIWWRGRQIRVRAMDCFTYV
jgi:ceramide glucosyltransferase